MNRAVIAVAAGALLLGAGAAGLAQAQDRDGRGRGGGGAAREAPRAPPQRAAPRVQQSQPRVERRQPRLERRAVQRPQRERAQQVQRQRERSVQRAERRERDQQQAGRRQREQKQQVERRQRDQQQRAQRDQREQQQRAERQQREQHQAAERRQREQQKQAQQKDRSEGKRADSPARPQKVNRVQASNEQRKGVRERIFRERRVDRIKARDFRARVVIGTHIERRHRRHLHRLTPAILAFAPIYAGYSYLVVDDDICIVDPATYYVVDVIPSSVEYAAGPSRPQLALSAEEMAFIYASVPKDRSVDVRVRLALGAEIPSRVDLEVFPDGVIDRVPQIESYRYIVVEDDVVIVDPRDRAVALVITE